MEPEHAERRFRKKVVKRLGVAVTDFRPEKLKTKVTGTPVGTGFCNFSCAYLLSRVSFSRNISKARMTVLLLLSWFVTAKVPLWPFDFSLFLVTDFCEK